MSKAAKRADPIEQRAFERTRTALEGKIFVPAEEATVDCRVVDLSAGGAGILCDDMPPLSTYVVLYVDGFGRFEAVVARVEGAVLALRFVCGEAKRARLVEKLKRYVETGSADATTLRRHRRVSMTPIPHFTRAGGERVDCEVIDISLAGASLKARTRPPIGEMILIGRMPARVVRHHETGVGIAFTTVTVPPRF
jgi:PilZ domain-containing protein